MSTIAERVAAGAAFLDEHDPGWWRPDVDRAIDLGALALEDTASCVLGQRCPLEVLAARIKAEESMDREPSEDELSYEAWRSYHAYAEHLSGLPSLQIGHWADDLGFRILPGGNYDALTAEWKRVIGQRRAAP